MILLNKVEEPSFVVNKELVIDYKEQGDIYLVDIRRELTKQLIFYKLYQDLQKVNSSFFYIISGLLDDTFNDLKEIKDGYSKMVGYCNILKKNIDNLLPTTNYDSICNNLDKLQLLIQKLIYIVENFCNVEDK